MSDPKPSLSERDIENMPVGREMDALVAERVMGYVWRNDTPGGRKRSLASPSGEVAILQKGGERSYLGYPNPSLPAYSTEIAAAWTVVEKMVNAFGISIVVLPGCIAVELVTTVGGFSRIEAKAETFPLAACRAALLACLREGGRG